MEIFTLLETLEDILENSKGLPFTNKTMVDKEELLEIIKEETLSPVLFCDETRKEEADYKFYYEDNRLLKYGKELEGEDITAEYIGIAKIGKEFISTFKNELESMINKQQHYLWWENALYELSKEKDIYVKDVEGRFWAEVDYMEDYERILKFRDYNIKFDISVCKNS